MAVDQSCWQVKILSLLLRVNVRSQGDDWINLVAVIMNTDVDYDDNDDGAAETEILENESIHLTVYSAACASVVPVQKNRQRELTMPLVWKHDFSLHYRGSDQKHPTNLLEARFSNLGCLLSNKQNSQSSMNNSINCLINYKWFIICWNIWNWKLTYIIVTHQNLCVVCHCSRWIKCNVLTDMNLCTRQINSW